MTLATKISAVAAREYYSTGIPRYNYLFSKQNIYFWQK